jgi:hypothetical protein
MKGIKPNACRALSPLDPLCSRSSGRPEASRAGALRRGAFGVGEKLRIWRAVFPDIALPGHAQVDIGIFGMGFRTPGADL